MRNILIFLAVVAFFAGIYFVVKPEKNAPHVEGPSVATSTPEVQGPAVIAPKKLIKETEDYSISIEYPFVEAGLNASVRENINDSIQAYVYQTEETFRESFEESLTGKGEFPEEPGNVPESTVEVEFEEVRQTIVPHVKSFIFSEYFYSSGAAHPGHDFHTITVDTLMGDVHSLEDFFKPGSDYIQRISKAAIKELKAHLGENALDSQIESGASANTLNFKNFYISNKGIGFLFGDYQVAPYAVGPQEVVIPYSGLKDVIDPDGLLKNIIRN